MHLSVKRERGRRDCRYQLQPSAVFRPAYFFAVVLRSPPPFPVGGITQKDREEEGGTAVQNPIKSFGIFKVQYYFVRKCFRTLHKQARDTSWGHSLTQGTDGAAVLGGGGGGGMTEDEMRDGQGEDDVAPPLPPSLPLS